MTSASPGSASALAQRKDAGKILLVDDEPSLIEAVGYVLRREGYTVTIATTGPAALTAARAVEPDLIVLDVMLPGLDGLQVCRELRAESTVPILLLSAKGEEVDRVIGLEIGADDYLAKPFAMRELLARVRAMLRRFRMAPTAASAESAALDGRWAGSLGAAGVIEAGDLTIDAARRRVTIAKTEIALKPKEFDLLFHLAQHPGIVHSRDVLLRRVWGYDFPVDTRTVDVHVRWLRQKIELDPSQPQRIETVRGVGYRFVRQDDPTTSDGP
ncbi:MAG: response regulator transcription factor [Chloroflexota bacterium]|nr:response regulator transcription factor [Chloroflexota bacterium]